MECKECGAALAHDQKYCTACGARRGNLPARISELFAPLDMPTPPLVAGVPPGAFAPPVAAGPAGFIGALDDWVDNFEIPSPRVIATATLALLAFGVLLGSVLGSSGGFGPTYLMPSAEYAAATAQQPEVAAAAAPVTAETVAEQPVGATGETPGATPATGEAAKVNHVWMIVLSNQAYANSFGNTASQSYLVTDLVAQGAVLPNYYAVAQGELANRSALISGQGPTWQITQNCPRYTPVAPATIDAATNQVIGDGCVYPETVHTIGDSITATGKTWATYVEDVANGANGRTTACSFPTENSVDPDHTSSAGNAYTTWSNPFAYFKSVSASPNCPFQSYGLGQLGDDLTAGKSPAFSLIVPNRCHDGSDTPCAPGAPAGLTATDSFLRDVVPRIMSSKDYLDGGLIAITFDQAPQGAPGADVSGCCSQPAFPNLAVPPAQEPATAAPTAPTGQTGKTGQTGETGQTGTTGTTSATGEVTSVGPLPIQLPTYVNTTADGLPAGGGKVGLLLLSKMVKPGASEATEDLNHFSLLLSIENWFGTEKLGYTAQTGMGALPDSLFQADGATGATGP